MCIFLRKLRKKDNAYRQLNIAYVFAVNVNMFVIGSEIAVTPGPS